MKKNKTIKIKTVEDVSRYLEESFESMTVEQIQMLDKLYQANSGSFFVNGRFDPKKFISDTKLMRNLVLGNGISNSSEKVHRK